ncbi:MAG: hypothetical protein GW858_01475 [Sphingomonadales bacterium]|nr:hypothetical protein [Sphingomonadales bacterium]NCQ19886.1 hypothetical protein [Sphingomonadales bacterium]NCT05123.1 hypothetical protein [Sphingomonadales bacterium]
MILATPTLIFVYNANGGLPAALGDMVHKIASPRTYPCSLCALTYGAFSMRREWRAFLGRIRLASLFLYRDEFRSDLDDRDLPLPAVLIAGDSTVPDVLVSAAELDALSNLSALIALIKARLPDSSS